MDVARLMVAAAWADGELANDEIEEIRAISIMLKLSRGEFIEAKLTVPREDRGGL